MTDTTDEVPLGPIDYIVIEYADGNPTEEALPYLVDLVDRGLIRVLDVALLKKNDDGSVVVLDMDDLRAVGAEGLLVFEGASTGMLSEEDINDTAAIISAGAIAVILVYENSWAGPFAAAVRRAGGQLVANGRIPVQALLAALEADEKENA